MCGVGIMDGDELLLLSFDSCSGVLGFGLILLLVCLLREGNV